MHWVFTIQIVLRTIYLFGCPGWLQGLIQADAFFKAGMAKKALIIGTETLSRVIDMYDRDSMIFSDGAGAVVLEGKEGDDHSAGLMASLPRRIAWKKSIISIWGLHFTPEAIRGSVI